MFTNRRHIRVAAGLVASSVLVVVASAGYTVKPGDTLAGVAASNGTTVSALAAANGIRNPNLIRIGQVLTIPGQAAPRAAIADHHVVVAGETLSSIALRYGVAPSELARINGIRNPNLIRIGTRLAIPSATAGGLHVVQPGESLESIARRYGTTVAVLAAANGLTNTDVVLAGATIRLSGEAFVAGDVQGTAIHTVTAGETLSSIAAQYGTTIRKLIDQNNLANPDLIAVGARLTVPAAGWRCPVPGATYINDWGLPRSGGMIHTGNDLFAPRGTPVLAPVPGVVTQITGSIGGHQFRLLGDDGVTYIGSHMDTFGASGRVAAGAVLGTVGDSGNARGSDTHLHFEMHPNDGQAVNPYPTLRKYGC